MLAPVPCVWFVVCGVPVVRPQDEYKMVEEGRSKASDSLVGGLHGNYVVWQDRVATGQSLLKIGQHVKSTEVNIDNIRFQQSGVM